MHIIRIHSPWLPEQTELPNYDYQYRIRFLKIKQIDGSVAAC